jgi:hypothetical protein
MNFKITWTSGLVTHEVNESVTPDAYALSRWGINSAAELKETFGVTIEVEQDEPVEPIPVKSAKKSSK